MEPIQFVPTEDFASPEFRSIYTKGLVYTVRPGNEKLAKAVAQWKAEGKVTIGPAKTALPTASVKGQGTVE